MGRRKRLIFYYEGAGVTSTQASVTSINGRQQFFNELLDIQHLLLAGTVHHAFVGFESHIGWIYQRF